MPTKITPAVYYNCDICGTGWDTLEEASDCQERGLGAEYPIGCIYGDNEPGAFYSGITFAVAENNICQHYNRGSSWAVRLLGGDSLGNEVCSGNSLSLDETDAKIDPDHLTFKRMVKWLQSQNIDVTVWNGKKAVPLNQWLKKRIPEKQIKTQHTRKV